MKLIDVYRLAVETGIKNDPRPAEDIERQLEDARKAFEKMEHLFQRSSFLKTLQRLQTLVIRLFIVSMIKKRAC